MNNYLLFFGKRYYPEGGIHDFKGSFETLEEAKEESFKLLREEGCSSFDRYTWAHIYDIKGHRVVWDTDE